MDFVIYRFYRDLGFSILKSLDMSTIRLQLEVKQYLRSLYALHFIYNRSDFFKKPLTKEEADIGLDEFFCGDQRRWREI